MRENILNGKWFICFGEGGNLINYAGQILGEVSDGWFYAAVFGHGLNITSRQVVAVTEFTTFRFYNSETEMVGVRRSFDKPMVTLMEKS